MPGGRPSKSVHLLKSEKKSHRTKAELEAREENENALLTGSSLKESDGVKGNAVAHKEFLRIKRLLKAIQKDDDLYGNVINNHCLLVAECIEIEDIKNRLIKSLDDFEDRCADEDMKYSEEMKIRVSIQKQILDCDRALMNKRKMLLDISKENIMTIASALRSIPKKVEDEQDTDPMSMLLGGGRPGR